ncbi:NAPRT1 nicotinate phosphoribosyltransferase [Thermotomaculum hydrothermale]|uniref:Nicotinate phosphoribosyltransferase n=1 Tax=Thermotomaculum hydrothermale TaxID=981385 RepID=A0A7R6PSN3_9BACT|nr:nicotinate phosphoribosyltransferase [Thermotomaculum hydrothermale]BBB33596.1 NAPRT1 nicotinate phosphoribosyltransferase [Thermotomaculum hydrothermale]
MFKEEYFSGLYTDFYELTMSQAYFLSGKKDERVVFDLYFRKNPFGNGYTIFAGLEDAINAVLNFRFSENDLNYLESLGFNKDFLDYLKDFRFQGSIYAFREGDVVFNNEPLLKVEGNIIEAQLLETMLLNFINYQTLIATKTRRMYFAAKGKTVVDFGMRRAQGFAAISGSKASYIGGAAGTSNTYAAKVFGIPPIGTHAHSWIQSFKSEYEAFKRYADIYPDSTTLLVDTYDTLKSGIPNAIKIAKYLESKGHKLKAIRLDSGDLAYLSKKARKMLDENGLGYVKIVVSNQLDENIIDSLLDQNAPIDIFGVGTKLITSYSQPALDGVYKLAEISGRPTLKFSENTEKINLPGNKKVVRVLNEDNNFLLDGVLLNEENENSIKLLRHPSIPFKKTEITDDLKFEKVFYKIVENGKLVYKFPTLKDVRDFSLKRFEQLPSEFKRFVNPHIYRVGLSDKLYNLRHSLIERRLENK